MEADFLLGMLVRRVEQSDFRTDITLTIGGMIMMGDMISEEQFCEGIAEDVPAEHQEYFRGLPDLFDELATEFAGDGEEPHDLRDDMRDSVVHLTNVRIFQEGEYHQFRRTFWRGKISTVDGFWLGTPSPDA